MTSTSMETGCCHPTEWTEDFDQRKYIFLSDCAPLEVPSDVTLSTDVTGFGTDVTLSCPRGYEFISGEGQDLDVRCLIGGKWSQSKIPACQRTVQSLFDSIDFSPFGLCALFQPYIVLLCHKSEMDLQSPPPM